MQYPTQARDKTYKINYISHLYPHTCVYSLFVYRNQNHFYQQQSKELSSVNQVRIKIFNKKWNIWLTCLKIWQSEKPKTYLDTDHTELLSRKCFLNPTKYTAELERKKGKSQAPKAKRKAGNKPNVHLQYKSCYIHAVK